MPTHHDPAQEDATPPDADEPAPAPLETDLVFELLKNQRRRRVVEHVRDRGTVALGDLAETIAADENDTTVAELSPDERKRVYIGLYQTHLPKMDDAGVVVYDQDRGEVSPGPAIDQLAPYLESNVTDDGDSTDGRFVIEFDRARLEERVTLPAWALLVSLLVVGLVSVAATVLPGPLWALVLVLAAAAATWIVHWEGTGQIAK